MFSLWSQPWGEKWGKGNGSCLSLGASPAPLVRIWLSPAAASWDQYVVAPIGGLEASFFCAPVIKMPWLGLAPSWLAPHCQVARADNLYAFIHFYFHNYVYGSNCELKVTKFTDVLMYGLEVIRSSLSIFLISPDLFSWEDRPRVWPRFVSLWSDCLNSIMKTVLSPVLASPLFRGRRVVLQGWSFHGSFHRLTEAFQTHHHGWATKHAPAIS